ncbi:hypothetical protein [Streptococcus jiangjianxini]|uniref:hypothetical protein n=1 Tax=Streptococcus jiangjianxini TaxID=3161189 RepID=UPI0032EC286B
MTKTYTLTEEELDQLLNERMAEKRFKVDVASAFRPVKIDDNKEITPINEKYPNVVEKLDGSHALNPRRFIFKEVPKVNKATGEADYHKVSDYDIHNALRLLTLRIFGVTKNNELKDRDIKLAQEFYTNFKNLFLESYDKRLEEMTR